MSPEKVLQDLLESQTLKPEQELNLKAHKKEVTDYLIAEFQEKNPTIKYAGSYEKGTMIRDCYDHVIFLIPILEHSKKFETMYLLI